MDDSSRRCVLSTVGTSLLTNLADDASQRNFLRDTANLAGAELSPDQRQALDEVVARVRPVLLVTTDVPRIRRTSAELNGLYGLYDGRLGGGGQDLHFLLATDTAQGRLAAELVAEHLRARGLAVGVEVVPGLSTRSQRAFADGAREIVRWCEATLPGYRESGYRVVFNLVGGFKSLQAYLNTIGMFYADEILYIFEAPTADLIRIPRLPVRVDLGRLAAQRELFALLADGWLAPSGELRDWPEALWEDDGQGAATLSAWGLLVWNRQKHELLASELLRLPGLVVSPSFERDFHSHASARERIRLQETLATVARLLLEHHGDTAPLRTDGGLLYETYAGQYSGVGHFRVSSGLRVSCTPSSQGLVLRRFGAHDAVNDRPL